MVAIVSGCDGIGEEGHLGWNTEDLANEWENNRRIGDEKGGLGKLGGSWGGGLASNGDRG